MPLFPFRRKLEASKGYDFNEIPLFSSLSPSEIRLLEKKFRLAEYKRSDLIYEEGKPAEAFYVIVSGRFRVFKKVRGEGQETLVYLYRGDYFGESSLLTDQVHSASVEARSDGILLRLDKADFLKTLGQIPALSLHLSRTLGHRLTKIEGPERKKREVKVAALYSTVPASEGFQFFIDLAASLVRETKSRVIVVDFPRPSETGIPAEFRKTGNLHLSKTESMRESDLKPSLIECSAGFYYLPLESEKGQPEEKKLSTLLTFLTYRYDFILIRLSGDMGDLSFKSLKQSDFIYLLLDPKTLSQTAPLIQQIEQTFGFAKSETKVILPEEDAAPSFEEKEKLLQLKIFSHLPSRSRNPERYHSAIRFITKEFAGTLLGLVLGSGAAYGLAHIGVLQVLEKENIPIDIVAGSSMGALIGAFWGAGYRANEIEKIACSLDQKTAFFKLIGFNDLSIAHRGFFHGRQVTHFMESYLGNRTFQELSLPVKIVATNLNTSQEIVFENGRIVDALRASISIPGIFRPFNYRGELLIDGGILNPLPVNTLAQMGVKKIIAVDVLSSPEDRAQRNRLRVEKKKKLQKEKAQEPLWKHLLEPVFDKVNRHFSSNIFNVIMNTIQFMEYEIAQVSSQGADVLIRPVVLDAHWAEFYQPKKFIKEGEKKTLEQINEIKRLLVE